MVIDVFVRNAMQFNEITSSVLYSCLIITTIHYRIKIKAHPCAKEERAK
jgi:hypothetical protein